MSEYFIVVNETKREFVDPSRFGENFKRGDILTGLHGRAVVQMLMDSASGSERLIGSWCGDKIVIAGDSAPVSDGTEQLYFRVRSEGYTDVSIRALAIVTDDSESAKTLVATAKRNPQLRADLWEVTRLYRRKNLLYYLEKEFGQC